MIDIESLLYRSEGETLDFKRGQYLFKGVDDFNKVELLKDIIAFANRWSSETAHILIGFEEVKGRRAIVHGIDAGDHIDNASLQQFVNEKTNRRIDFNYYPLTFEEKSIAVIQIPVQRERPYYLLTDFPSPQMLKQLPKAERHNSSRTLLQNTVYIRDKDTTRIAFPDEIASMGRHSYEQMRVPSLDIQFFDEQQQQVKGVREYTSRYLRVLNKNIKIPDYDGQGFASNRDFYRELLTYLNWQSFYYPTYFIVRNTGNINLEGLKIKATIPINNIVTIKDDLGEKPRKVDRSVFLAGIDNLGQHDDSLELTKRDDYYIATYLSSGIKPKDNWITPPIYIGANVSTTVYIAIQIFGNNLPEPIGYTLTLGYTLSQKAFSFHDLHAIANNFGKDVS